MSRAACLFATAALLVAPTLAAFDSGGATPAARLDCGIGAAVVIVLAVAATWGRRLLPGGPAAIGVLSLVLLAAWTAAASTWSPLSAGADEAVVLAGVYLAMVLAAIALLQARDVARAVEPALAAGAVIVIGYGLAGRLLPGLVHVTPSARAGGRLDQPLTYWNAMGALAALGLVLAARLNGDPTRGAPIRTAAAAALPVLGAGLYLSFSRAAIAATLAGVLLVVVLDPRRSSVRALALAAVAAGLGVAAVAPFGGVRALSGSVGHRESQGVASLLLLAAATLCCSGLQALLQRRPAADRLLSRGARGVAAAACVVVALLPFVAAAADRSDAGSATFGATSARLTSVGSNRLQYWRVAANSWLRHPLAGEGAGSFQATWLRHRRIDEWVHNAHSVELETASELGTVGLALLLALIGAVAVATRRAAQMDPALVAGPAAALGTWLLHASVDWDWQVPALTALAAILAGLVLSVRTDSGPAAPAAPTAG